MADPKYLAKVKKTGRGENWLKKGERCPLHNGSIRCECHGKVHCNGPFQSVRQIEDKFHPRGYRERCSPSELRRRKHVLMAADPSCWICKERFTTYSEIDLEHKEPKGMGGARHDDHMDNLALAHRKCNSEKGSRRIPVEENTSSSNSPTDLTGPQVLGDSERRTSFNGLHLQGKRSGGDSEEGET